MNAGRLARALVLLLAAAGCRGSGSSPSPSDLPPPRTPGSGAGSLPAAGRARPPRPLTPARLDALAALAVPAHEVQVLARGAADVALAVTAADGSRAIVTASGCLGCVAPAVPAWEAQRPYLAALWAPGGALAIAALDLGRGDPAIALDARRADGNAVAIAHWNDGTTQLQASCEYVGTPTPATCPALVERALSAALATLAP